MSIDLFIDLLWLLVELVHSGFVSVFSSKNEAFSMSCLLRARRVISCDYPSKLNTKHDKFFESKIYFWGSLSESYRINREKKVPAASQGLQTHSPKHVVCEGIKSASIQSNISLYACTLSFIDIKRSENMLTLYLLNYINILFLTQISFSYLTTTKLIIIVTTTTLKLLESKKYICRLMNSSNKDKWKWGFNIKCVFSAYKLSWCQRDPNAMF